MVTAVSCAVTTIKITSTLRTAVAVHPAQRTVSLVSKALCGDGLGGSLREVQPPARGCTASARPGLGSIRSSASGRGSRTGRYPEALPTCGSAGPRACSARWSRRLGSPSAGPRFFHLPTGGGGAGGSRGRSQRRDPKNRIGCWGRGRAIPGRKYGATWQWLGRAAAGCGGRRRVEGWRPSASVAPERVATSREKSGRRGCGAGGGAGEGRPREVRGSGGGGGGDAR